MRHHVKAPTSSSNPTGLHPSIPISTSHSFPFYILQTITLDGDVAFFMVVSYSNLDLRVSLESAVWQSGFHDQQRRVLLQLGHHLHPHHTRHATPLPGCTTASNRGLDQGLHSDLHRCGLDTSLLAPAVQRERAFEAMCGQVVLLVVYPRAATRPSRMAHHRPRRPKNTHNIHSKRRRLRQSCKHARLPHAL